MSEGRRPLGPRNLDQERRRNAVMLNALPDLPPSPSYRKTEEVHVDAVPADESGVKLQRRQARTMEPRQRSVEPTAQDYDETRAWTDVGQLVASPDAMPQTVATTKPTLNRSRATTRSSDISSRSRTNDGIRRDRKPTQMTFEDDSSASPSTRPAMTPRTSTSGEVRGPRSPRSATGGSGESPTAMRGPRPMQSRTSTGSGEHINSQRSSVEPSSPPPIRQVTSPQATPSPPSLSGRQISQPGPQVDMLGFTFNQPQRILEPIPASPLSPSTGGVVTESPGPHHEAFEDAGLAYLGEEQPRKPVRANVPPPSHTQHPRARAATDFAAQPYARQPAPLLPQHPQVATNQASSQWQVQPAASEPPVQQPPPRMRHGRAATDVAPSTHRQLDAMPSSSRRPAETDLFSRPYPGELLPFTTRTPESASSTRSPSVTVETASRQTTQSQRTLDSVSEPRRQYTMDSSTGSSSSTPYVQTPAQITPASSYKANLDQAGRLPTGFSQDPSMRVHILSPDDVRSPESITRSTTPEPSSRAKFSPPTLIKALAPSSRHKQATTETGTSATPSKGKSGAPGHVKNKGSSSTLAMSPPATQTQFVNVTGKTSSSEQPVKWDRLRTAVKQVPPVNKTLFQLLGRHAGSTYTGGDGMYSAGGNAQMNTQRSRLEDDIMRAIWIARFGMPIKPPNSSKNAFGELLHQAKPSVSSTNLMLNGNPGSGVNNALPLPSVHFGLGSAFGKRAMGASLPMQAPAAPAVSVASGPRRTPASVRPILSALQPHVGAPVPQSAQSEPMLLQPGAPFAMGHKRTESAVSMSDLMVQYGDNEKVMGKAPLPREEEVLKVLAMPFMVNTPDEWGGVGGRRALDEERWAAFEGFEMVLRGWDADSPKADVERALWLIRAARSKTPRLGFKILGTLEYHLFHSPHATKRHEIGVAQLLSLVAVLLELQATVVRQSETGGEYLENNVRAITFRLMDGECSALSMDDVEDWYNVKADDADRMRGRTQVRQAVWRDAVVRTLELGAVGVRSSILANMLEENWEEPEEDEPAPSSSKLVNSITLETTRRFLKSAPGLLKANPGAPRAALNLLRTRVLPLLQDVGGELQRDCRRAAVALAFELMAVDGTAQVASEVVSEWLGSGVWKEDVEAEVKDLTIDAEWRTLSRFYSSVMNMLPRPQADRLASVFVQNLFVRLVDNPSLDANDRPMATMLLQRLARDHKHAFFGPVIECAMAVKDIKLITLLRTLRSLAQLIPDFWVYDAELMAIAIAKDAGGKGKGKEGDYGRVRMGQCLLLVLLIEDVHKRVTAKKDMRDNPSAGQASAVKFYQELELRVSLLLTEKESSSILPFSQRQLIVTLLYQIRLFTWSVRGAACLQRVIKWALQALPATFIASPHDRIATIDALHEWHDSTRGKLLSLFVAASDAPALGPSKLSRATLALSTVNGQPQTFGVEHGTAVFDLVPETLAEACAKLLVLLFQLVETGDYQQLGPVLWDRFLDSTETSILEPASFLVMQAAEKHSGFVNLIINDLQSSIAPVRQRAIQRLAVLFARRFQIMTQTFIYDRRHRPFQTKRTVLTFVPADAGSGQFVLEEDEQALRDRFGSALPRETIKRLLEIDWVQDEKPADKRLEMIRTPFSALSSAQLDRGLDADADSIPSLITPSASAESSLSAAAGKPSPQGSPSTAGKQLLRRKSSASNAGSTSKRRPIFVAPLVSILPLLARAVSDPDILIGSAARDLLVDVMREDAGSLCRPIMDSISADGLRIVTAVDDIRAFLHVQHALPPAMTHFIFTHLAGFLRAIAKVDRNDSANSLFTFSYTVPMLAKLVSHVSNLGAQDLRRAKLEVFTLPSGPLWFSSSAPAGPMFPRALDDVAAHVPASERLQEIEAALISITMIRTSQNMLLLSMLRRNQGDIVVVRKNLNRLVLPSRESTTELKQLVVGDFLPRSPEAMRSKSKDLGLVRISLALSRSYLLLVTEIFRCLPRGMSDRVELGRLLDGVNRILLTHGDDIGIVSHALTACMIAAVRFRRLFSTSSAFILFMPSLIKVYCEATEQRAIRRAIEYAMSRFYQLHEDVVIYQILDIASYMAAHPSAEKVHAWLASGVVALISSLKTAPHPGDGDAAGIHGVAEKEEKEARMALLVEKQPESLGVLLQNKPGAPGTTQQAPTSVLDNIQHKTFPLDNLAKFLFTIIAFENTTLRAEQFLRLLRCMVPYLYHVSVGIRAHLDTGINSLGITLFFKNANAPGQPETQLPSAIFASNDYGDGGILLGNPKAPCDPSVMRREYLRLITAFSKAGGVMNNPTAHRALALVRLMLKDDTDEAFKVAERFTVEYVEAAYAGGVYSHKPEQTQQQLGPYAPIFQVYCDKCDFSSMLSVLDRLCAIPEIVLRDDKRHFQAMVMRDFLKPAVQTCAKLSEEGHIFNVNMRLTLVPLLNTALSLPAGDPIGALEECTSSPGFLAGIILPLCLKLKTSKEIEQIQLDVIRSAYSRAWLRLLAYALQSWRMATSPNPSSDPEKGGTALPQSETVSLANLAFSLQIIKIITIRGEEVLSDLYPDAWNMIGTFILSVLAGGNATFGFVGADRVDPFTPYSPGAISAVSPRFRRDPTVPRVVDYLMWSMMHFVCAYRSPLMIQLRLRVLESCTELHNDLHRTSSMSPPGSARHSRQNSATMFARGRSRNSISSAPGTPELSPAASPQMTPTKNPFATKSPSYVNLASPPPMFVLSPPASAVGKNAEPVPLARRGGIRHLGPANATTLPQASFKPNTAGSKTAAFSQLNSLACSTYVRTPTLVQACVRHVRQVQMFMGYDRMLLPMPAQNAGFEDMMWDELPTVLSASQALAMVARETAQLIQEFKAECYAEKV